MKWEPIKWTPLDTKLLLIWAGASGFVGACAMMLRFTIEAMQK